MLLEAVVSLAIGVGAATAPPGPAQEPSPSVALATEQPVSVIYSHDRSMQIAVEGQWTVGEADGYWATAGDRLDFKSLPYMTFDYLTDTDLAAAGHMVRTAAMPAAFNVGADASIEVTEVDDGAAPALLVSASGDRHRWLYLRQVAGGVLMVSWFWPNADRPHIDLEIGLGELIAYAFMTNVQFLTDAP